MHIAAYTMATGQTIPALKRLRDAIDAKSKQWAMWSRSADPPRGRGPADRGQEWSGYAGALDDAIAEVEHATDGLLQLAMAVRGRDRAERPGRLRRAGRGADREDDRRAVM